MHGIRVFFTKIRLKDGAVNSLLMASQIRTLTENSPRKWLAVCVFFFVLYCCNIVCCGEGIWAVQMVRSHQIQIAACCWQLAHVYAVSRRGVGRLLKDVAGACLPV